MSAWINAGATVASSLLGSVFSGGQKRGPSMQDQIGIQGDLTWDQLQTRHRFGEKYGIHPLVMMGINPSSGGLVPQNYSTPPSMGQNLGRAMAAGIQGYQQSQLQKLAVERAKLENELLKTQITNVNKSPGTAPTQVASGIDGQGQYLVNPDENTSRKLDERGLTAGSKNPPPAGKRITVGSTPYGDVTMVAPPSGQFDEYGELYGSVKGIEYLAKRGYVHYMRAGSKIIGKLKKKQKRELFRLENGQRGYYK